jgi:hypothetical protein
MWLLVVLLLLVAPARSTIAAPLGEAKVTQIIQNVQLLPTGAAPKPAVVNDIVRGGIAVRTGADSRTELTFTDQTLTRLGANTIFSLNQGTRTLDLGRGAMLLQVPKNVGGAKITTASITASITGTTIMLEFHPQAPGKLMLLDGSASVWLNILPQDPVNLDAGQMIIIPPNATKLPQPVYFSIEKVLQTSFLIRGFRPLSSLDLILLEVRRQRVAPPSSGLIDPTGQDTIDQSINAHRPPPPPVPHGTP